MRSTCIVIHLALCATTISTIISNRSVNITNPKLIHRVGALQTDYHISHHILYIHIERWFLKVFRQIYIFENEIYTIFLNDRLLLFVSRWHTQRRSAADRFAMCINLPSRGVITRFSELCFPLPKTPTPQLRSGTVLSCILDLIIIARTLYRPKVQYQNLPRDNSIIYFWIVCGCYLFASLNSCFCLYI